MREIRLSGSEGGAGHLKCPVPTPITGETACSRVISARVPRRTTVD